jgi:hypothetical protein
MPRLVLFSSRFRVSGLRGDVKLEFQGALKVRSEVYHPPAGGALELIDEGGGGEAGGHRWFRGTSNK